MDPVRNPYTPNAGATPPYLAGREQQIRDFEILLDRLASKRTEKAMALVGLRGVGKTVLLLEFERIALEKKWIPIQGEVSKNVPFAGQMASLARKALLRVSPKARWGELARSAASIIKAFSLSVQPDGTLTAGLDVVAAEGIADTGSLIDDLPDVFEAIGHAARERGTGVVFLLDEIQFVSKEELEALIASVHRATQRKLPVTFTAAGLPQLPGLSGDAKSYAERAFRYVDIDALPQPEADAALVRPASDEDVQYEVGAISKVFEYTEGYPYFIQEYGRAAWNLADVSPISAEIVEEAKGEVDRELDDSFYRTRVQRSTKEELRYLRAMAELGKAEQKASDVADVLGKTSEQVAPLRARLISKGLLYTPRFGYAKFTVPQFDIFMRRYMPDLDADPAGD
ncbi:ATP-binding protein [Microbacterium sp. S1037]|uniref:ATP-binding protein n=1 Tax=Microbacterium sp. S1037 TaxID=3398227 RepID=UPI003AAE0A20